MAPQDLRISMGCRTNTTESHLA
uniref:Uncharacterized protein n=1 Tax=Rhizophora mucronata TaxID=61149 RepID=A0A2P2Q0A9_RHIMU